MSRAALRVLALCLALGGCATVGAPRDITRAAASEEPADVTARAPTFRDPSPPMALAVVELRPGPATAPALPEQLVRYERRVEDTVDALVSGAPLAPIRHHAILEVERAWNPVREALESRGVSEPRLELVEDRLVALARARRRSSRDDLARALDALAEQVDDLYAGFRDDPELQALRLEVLAHELLLDARDEAWSLGPHHASEALAVWQTFEREAGADAEPARLEEGRRLVDRARVAAVERSAPALEAASEGLLEVAEQLEVAWGAPTPRAARAPR